MKLIELTKGFYTKIDDEDYDKVIRYSWYAAVQKYTQCAKRKRTIDGKSKIISLHRYLLNPHKNELIDHKDGDGLNNQKSNLRICNKSQNNANRRPTGASKYLGVTPCVANKSKWVARIRNGKTTIHLGLFKNEIDAAKAYDKAAKLQHGEFANLNFKEKL